MAKRNEIARVLTVDPKILMMDEPFGALDAQTKIAVQNHLLHLLQTMRETVLFVTHDLEEDLILPTGSSPSAPARAAFEASTSSRWSATRDARQVDYRFPEVLRAIWDDIEPSGCHP